MATWYKWRVWCNTDSQYETVISDTKPTYCPTNPTGHTIDQSKTGWTEERANKLIKIDEGSLTNTGKFVATTLSFDCPGPAGTVSQGSISWDYDITALSMSFVTDEANRGDKLDLVIGENSPAGALASSITPATAHSVQNYTAGDIVTYNGKTYTCILDTVSNELPTNKTYWKKGFRLHVTSTVTANINNGYHVCLSDVAYGGSNTDNMGEVWSIDTVNNYIYVENPTPLSNSYSHTTPPTVVLLSLQMLENFEISGPDVREFGGDKVGGALITDETVVTIKYTNVDGVANKRFTGEVAFLRGSNVTS